MDIDPEVNNNIIHTNEDTAQDVDHIESALADAPCTAVTLAEEVIEEPEDIMEEPPAKRQRIYTR